ncbi:MAG: DegV family protein [Clostridia bacterium]|nr:DegV family protein [Clostridia bacterium]
MEKIALITDSSCDLPEEIINKYNIHVLPLRIIFQDGDYRDRVDITPEEFYRRLNTEMASTSMPSVGETWELFENLKKQGYTHVLAILISGGLSGTLRMVESLKEKTAELGLKLKTIDSKALSLGLGFLVMHAGELLKKNIPLQDIITKVESLVEETKVYFVLKTLEYLKKGGRIGLVEGTIGDILDIKPIISINKDGIYYSIAKVRGRNRSLNKIIDIAKEAIGNRKVFLAVMHGDALEEAQYIMEKLKEAKLNIVESFIGQTTASMAAHTGPGLVGITFCPV